MIPTLITARLGSTRLPRKHLLPLGRVPVIEHIVLRCEHFGFRPIICVPKGEEDTFNAATSCIEVFGGDPDNVEARLIEAAHHYKLDLFHHLDGDDPFFDRDAVIDSMQSFRLGKFSRIEPSVYSQAGTGLVGTSYHLKAASDSKVEILPDPSHQIWPMRLTLDYEEDYHLLLAVNRIVEGHMAPRWAVDRAFERNPDLHKINWFRNEEWKKRQSNE